MDHGVKLADGTFLEGSCGQFGDSIEIVISSEDAVSHFSDFMNPEKTKTIVFVINNPVATYEGFTVFQYMQPDEANGKMRIYMKKP